MITSGDRPPFSYKRRVYGQYKEYEEAVDGLVTSAISVLYNQLGRETVRTRVREQSYQLVHERDFTMFARMAMSTDSPSEHTWMSIPACLVHRERTEYYGIEDQFALALGDRGAILAWNRMSNKVWYHTTDQPHVYLTQTAIVGLADLLTSPMFIDYSTDTGKSEILPPPNEFGIFDQKATEYNAVASFLVRAAEL